MQRNRWIPGGDGSLTAVCASNYFSQAALYMYTQIISEMYYFYLSWKVLLTCHTCQCQDKCQFLWEFLPQGRFLLARLNVFLAMLQMYMYMNSPILGLCCCSVAETYREQNRYKLRLSKQLLGILNLHVHVACFTLKTSAKTTKYL